jgi:integrase
MAVERWLERLRPSTHPVARYTLRRFEGWLHINGGDFKDYSLDQLVMFQRNAEKIDSYKVLDLVQRYVGTTRGALKTKQNHYTYLRSFFMHNRADLPLDRSFRITGDKPRVQGVLSPDDIRRLVLSCNPCFQAVFLCMFQGAMGIEELLWWSKNGLESLQAQLEAGAQAVKVDLPGRKRYRFEKPYYTFVSGDALTSLRKWMTLRPKDATSIFTHQGRGPLARDGLQSYWIRHMRRLGIISGVKAWDKGNRTGRNIHEMRDVFRSQWAKSSAKAEVGEYVMGHSIDSLEYNKSFHDVDLYRKEYLKALPLLQVMSSGRPFKMVDEEEVESLRNEVQRLREQTKDADAFVRQRIDIFEKTLMDNADKEIEKRVNNMIQEKLKKILEERNLDKRL